MNSPNFTFNPVVLGIFLSHFFKELRFHFPLFGCIGTTATSASASILYTDFHVDNIVDKVNPRPRQRYW